MVIIALYCPSHQNVELFLPRYYPQLKRKIAETLEIIVIGENIPGGPSPDTDLHKKKNSEERTGTGHPIMRPTEASTSHPCQQMPETLCLCFGTARRWPGNKQCPVRNSNEAIIQIFP